MNTVVMKIGQGTTANLTKDLYKHQISVNNPYVSFAAKLQGTTVLVYTSGKIVFQGSGAVTLAQQFGYQLESGDTMSATSSGQDIPLIGSDEVGNGSYFGGLAMVASFVKPEDHSFLKRLGVDDSKRLTDSNIRQIAPILKENIIHKALLLTPKKYNEVVGKEKDYNAVSVKVALHNQAIFLLLQEGVTPEKIVIDAFTSKSNYLTYLKEEKNQFTNPISLEEKAEGKYLAVAVSSIIARDLFLDNLEQLSQELGYTLPSGAGAKSDKVASQILSAYGMSGLDYSAKLHFANTKKAQTLLKNHH